MSENVSNQNNNRKLVNLIESTNCYNREGEKADNNKEEKNFPFNHMYTSNTENGELDLAEVVTCQSTESEVKFWKEWLILHLDLIQQQNDEILNKERTILILQEENEMLKERISCMERGAPFQPTKFFNRSTSILSDRPEMTQDVSPTYEDSKNCLDLLNVNFENGDKHDSLNHSLSDGEFHMGNLNKKFTADVKFRKLNDKIKTESEILNCKNTNSEYDDFAVNNSSEFDPMENLKTSIRKKRLSNSSAISNNDSLDEKHSYQRLKKRRKRVIKDTPIVSTSEQYITEASETNIRMSSFTDLPIEITNSTNLEVPRWRVKHYASCYTMEGTENLDDEVYNKRHSRLENDERRRKRWDVQRIREQRLVEKLKQRQDRTGSGTRADEQIEPIQSLWPTIEDIRYLEVSDQLPVAAFGCPIPKITPSEFNLPWLINQEVTKKPAIKRSGAKRKSSKR